MNDLDDILLQILRDMASDIEAYGYTDSKSYLDGARAMIEDYVTYKTAKARFSELTQIGPLRNGSRKAYSDHYEYRYKFLKNIMNGYERYAQSTTNSTKEKE